MMVYLNLYLARPVIHLFGVGVKLKDEIWKTQNTHLWLAKPRPVVIESGQTVIQHHCARCGRDFVTNAPSDSRIAVFVSAISFHHLSDEVTKRWLTEDCPRARLSSDEEDRKRRIAELKVVNDEGLLTVSMPDRRHDVSTTRPKRRTATATAGSRTFERKNFGRIGF
jgi:hypothetical protein